MKRRIILSISTFLTLTFLAFPVIANATTYYVATNGSNTSPYDTWAKAAASIQTAVNAASNGDIIIVGSSDGHGAGTYTENVNVNNQLTIQSENGNSTTTIVAASLSDHVFEVTDDNVTINGFSIYGATGAGKAGIYLASLNNCTIENNRCGWDGTHNNNRGIYLASSDSSTITNNITSYNTGEGIYLSSSNSNNLTSNTVNNNSSDGISLSSSSSNTLTSNTANDNSFDGIRLVPSSNSNTITNNMATANGNNGFLIVASSDNNLTGNTANNNSATNGIYLVSSSNNTLNNNTANSNVGNGIRLESCTGNELDSNTVTHNEFGVFLTSSSNNTITYNIMNENDGRVDGDGIMLTGSDNNVISNNTMNDDPGDGIEFYNSSNNTVMGNTLDNSGLIDPGGSMRINYYSSNNTIINNTVINGAGGIVLEESSNYNFVSNNTVTGHSGRGIEFWENASYNTLTRNNISNNGTYGIWLPSGNYNTIYLNELSNNAISNVYSESSTTTWHSPTTIHYNYNSGTFHKGYLGNYYSDGTHTGSNGIGGTYTIPNDNDDDYQLIQTPDNYSLQAWWLHSDNKMYRDDMTNAGGSVTISGGGSNIWIADQAALTTISFSGSDTWTGQLVFTSAPTSAHTLTIEIGSSTNGSDFTAGGPDATLTGDGSNQVFTYTTDTSAFTVTTGNYLALRITSIDADYSVFTGGAWSFTTGEDTVTFVNDPPVNTIAPALSGTATEDELLSVDNGSWTDDDGDSLTFTYQWYSDDDSLDFDGSAITDAFDSTYTLTNPDVDYYIYAVVTANDGYVDVPVNSNYSSQVVNVNDAPVNTTAPALSGTATEDTPLSVNTGTWNDDDGDNLTFTYQWYSDSDGADYDGTAITDAADSTFTPTNDYVDLFLYTVVTANDGYVAVAANSNYSHAVINVNDAPMDTTAPAISGIASEAGELSVSTGSWTDDDGDVLTFTYQWYSDDDNLNYDGSTITDSTDSTYTLTNADVGQFIYAVVTADDGNGGSTSANSNYTDQVTTLGLDDELIPVEYSLSQNYPNPFNPVTTISYQLPKPAFVNLAVYNVTGQLIETLTNEHKNAGYYQVVWNAGTVGSGLYFYRIEAGEYTKSMKCVVIK